MSPSDLGQHLKPFVFLDLFEADMAALRDGMPLHPHSGIGAITVLTRGSARFDEPQAGSGMLGYGGVEWMQAGGGVWHGKELSPGDTPRVQGFQLWIALPPTLENGRPESQYIEAHDMPQAGPAFVILGSYGGATSPVRAPAEINYLLVSLKPGERWTYNTPPGHLVGFLAVSAGSLEVGGHLVAGELGLFEDGEEPIIVEATGLETAVFVLGTASKHNYPLHLGNYSVHTTADALIQGERRISELAQQLARAGDRRTASGSVPVFRQ